MLNDIFKNRACSLYVIQKALCLGHMEKLIFYKNQKSDFRGRLDLGGCSELRMILQFCGLNSVPLGT